MLAGDENISSDFKSAQTVKISGSHVNAYQRTSTAKQALNSEMDKVSHC